MVPVFVYTLPNTFKVDMHVAAPFNFVVPDTFNTLRCVSLIDKLFKLLNNVVDVAFKLLIDYVELVDKLFKFEFIPNTDKPDVVI
jgi:hypothetical protein